MVQNGYMLAKSLFIKNCVTKSTGLDGIPARFLKDAAPIIKLPITFLINQSISEETVPEEIKTAKVKPLFKKGDRLKPENYRPLVYKLILTDLSRALSLEIFIREETPSWHLLILVLAETPVRKQISMESEVCLTPVEISDSDLASLQHTEVLEVGYTEIAQSEMNDSECMTPEEQHANLKTETRGETSINRNNVSNQITETVKLGQGEEKIDKDRNSIVVQMDGENATLLDKSGILPVENVFQMENGLGDGGYIILSGDAAASLGVESDEPATKKIRIDGESYIVAVTEEGNTSVSIEQEKSGSDQQMFLVTTSGASGNVTPQKTMGVKQESEINQAWFTTRDDKQALHNTGASWKKGQWTNEEVEILQSNINNYCKEHNITDPTEIIFEMSKDERKNFYRTVAKGLMRPLFSVYRRVTRMYDQKNYMGKYTQEEINLLKELRKMYGNDWATIGQALGRSASSVKDKCRLMKETCNSGKWLPEEEKRLCDAVYELTGAKQGESVTSGLSWSNVAEKVVTRSEKQCRTKWLNYMNWKQKGGTEWTREDDMNLIIRISGLGVANDTEIDWKDLADNWPSVRSPQWLRGKWWSLKRNYRHYQSMPFQELLEHLKTNHVGNVRMKNQVKVSTEMVAMPVTLQTGADGSTTSESLHTYEILHQTSSGAFLITQPNTNPAITINGSPVTTDHIIVHTLPTSTALPEQENLAVQMNPVILNAASDSLSLDSAEISLQSSTTSTEQDLNDQMISTSAPEIDTQTEISSTPFENETIASSVIEGDQEDNQSQIVISSENELQGNYKLVMVTAGNDSNTEYMFSQSDPMLPSGETDLMGASSDVDSDKVQGQVTLDISSPDITSSAT
ncbi:cyclin-D-binding Myb-like transcription factor 1 [Ostrea edulis]|uniref:cyclin-D-binding Myb-like transcription factor 1 n=1 Tax=Ostrea edulis TaxID=37623 RepID=UPI0024AF8960|nr:cyclin-D-binding Myb-like transcription factor 1 [Ostrea edulis]